MNGAATRAVWSGLALLASAACSDATSAASEELADPGPHDTGVDRALSFDGVDDYASAGTARSPQILRDQSLMLWFRHEGAASGSADDLQVLFTLRRSDWSGIVLALEQDVPFVYNVFGPRPLVRSPTALAPGAWHHMAYVIRATASELYVDGVLVMTSDPDLTNRTPTQAFLGSLDGYTNMFHGSLDELRVYDRAFTPEEVAAITAGTVPDDAEALVMYLPFDEAEGARVYDRSGLGNHAELGDGVPELMPQRIASDLP